MTSVELDGLRGGFADEYEWLAGSNEQPAAVQRSSSQCLLAASSSSLYTTGFAA